MDHEPFSNLNQKANKCFSYAFWRCTMFFLISNYLLILLEVFSNSRSHVGTQQSNISDQVLASMPLPTRMMKASWHTYSNLGELWQSYPAHPFEILHFTPKFMWNRWYGLGVCIGIQFEAAIFVTLRWCVSCRYRPCASRWCDVQGWIELCHCGGCLHEVAWMIPWIAYANKNLVGLITMRWSYSLLVIMAYSPLW